jgi:acetyl-CoA synthetase
MLILDTPTHPAMKPDSWELTARAWAAAQQQVGARAAVVATLPEGMPPALADELGAAGIAPLIGIEDALQAFAAAATLGERHAQPVAALPWPPDPASRATTTDAAGAVPTDWVLRESEAKALLAQYGIVVPVSAECSTGEAAAVASRIGFPVVLKISDDAIAHKSDVGGVALGLRSPDEVAAAATRMATLGDRVLVEQMVGGAVAELIVGVVRDPQFGFALLVGAGGVLAELLTDSVTVLLPATRDDLERAVRRLRVWTLVEGHRGRRGDPESVLRAILAVADFAEAHRDRLLELDVNPLLVLPDRAVAVDALIKMTAD